MSTDMEYSSYPRDCATMDSLERQLICPICLEMFTKPVVILPCQHNLCRKCANDIFQSRGTTLGSAGRFRCPSCRHEVVLDRHGIYGLQRNLLVENIIDIYKQASARGPERPLLKTEHPTCEEHEEEKINIYCVSCAVPTCSLCKVFGEHKDCDVAPLSDIYTKQKAELTDGIGGLVAANDRIQAYIGNLQSTSKNIENNCKAQKQALCEKFDRMCAILEERRKIMLQRITYEQENKIQQLKSLGKACSDHIDSSSKLVDTALQSMEEPQMAVFVQNAKVLILKIIEMSQNCKPEALEPGFDNMEHYTVDFNTEERILYQLDFIKLEESEPTAEDDGPSGEAEDPLVECGAASKEGREDTKDFMAFGNEEQTEGGALLATETLSRIASGITVTPLGVTQMGTEGLAGPEGNMRGSPQGQLDGELYATSPSTPAALLDSALLSNMSIQGMGQPYVEVAMDGGIGTKDSSEEPEVGGSQRSNREEESGHVHLLHGVVAPSSQPATSNSTTDTWRQEDIVQPLLSSCFNPTLWLHD